jgi:DNA adenine methylase
VQTGRLGVTAEVPSENLRAAFDRHRARFNELAKSADTAFTSEVAALFFYLNRTAFNGLCRFNSRGEFNLPFGRYRKISYWRDWAAYAKQFENWIFTAQDFRDLKLRPDDFVYADPPYDVEFTTFAPGGFSWADQVMLAGWLAKHPGPVVLVNQSTPRIRALYRGLGYTLAFKEGPRRINHTGDRTPAREVFATRNLR